MSTVARIAEHLGYGIWHGSAEGRRPKGAGKIQRVRMNDGTYTLRVAYLGEVTRQDDRPRVITIGWRALDPDRYPADTELLVGYVRSALRQRVDTHVAGPDDDRQASRYEAERAAAIAALVALDALPPVLTA